MSAESSSSDLRIRELIDEFIAQKKSDSPQTAKEFAARYPDVGTKLLTELRRAEMFVDVWQNADENAKTIRESTEKRLRVICPECKSSIDLEPDSSWSSITCDSCKTNFSLIGSDDDLNFKSKQIGHFDLIERVGIGSFGTVWRAYDRELDRMAAIKMPRKGQLTPLESEHFLREARAAAQINHPNIVKVFEVGRVEDRVFIASEFVAGESLAQALSASDYSFRESARLVCKLATALHHAHQVGVVHRDLKPGNILIDESGEPHIADFGMAKRDAGDITMTRTGAVMGTPAFMAPEQAKGLAHHSDARSDIYSLGVILFRMITGELPFRGSTAALLQQVIHDEPPSPRKFNDKIPRDLETICLKCLEKQPEKRFATGAELADEVQRFLDNKPITARPISFPERIWRWCKRKPALAGALALAFLIFVVGTVTSTVLSIEAARESRNAAAAMETANRRIYAADMNRVQQAVERNNQIQAKGILQKYLPLDNQPDLRQIEWHYWWRKCNPGFLNQHRTNDRIFSVAVSPDGNHVVWGEDTGDLYQCSIDFSRVNKLEAVHNGPVKDIGYSNDGRYCVTASDDGTAMIWSAPDMKLLERKRFPGKTSVWAARFWTDRNWLVMGTTTAPELNESPANENLLEIKLTVVDYQSGKVIDQFNTAGFYPWLALSPAGTLAAIGDSERGQSFVVRDIQQGKNVWKKTTENNFFGRPTFRCDGTELIVPYWDYSDKDGEKFIVVDGTTGEVTNEALRRQGAANPSELVFSHDQQHLMAGTGKGGIDVYDAKSLHWIATLPGHTNRVSDLAVSTIDGTVVSVSDDQFLRRWRFDQTSNPVRIPVRTNSKKANLCFGSKNNQLYLGTPPVRMGSDAENQNLSQHNNDAVKRDASSSYSTHPSGTRLNHLRDVQFVTYSPIEKSVFFIKSCPESSAHELYRCDADLNSPQLIDRFLRPFAKVECLPDGNLVLCEMHSIPFSRNFPVALAIYAVKERKLIKEFGGKGAVATHHMSIYDWALSADQKWLATCSRDRTVSVWDFETGQLKYSKSIPNTINPIQSVDISYRGILATGETNGHIVLRNLDDGSDLREILAHDERVLFVRFTRDGNTLISGSTDSTIKIWDAVSGQLRTELMGDDVPFIAFAISPSETHLAACDQSGRVWVWDLSPADVD